MCMCLSQTAYTSLKIFNKCISCGHKDIYEYLEFLTVYGCFAGEIFCLVRITVLPTVNRNFKS